MDYDRKSPEAKDWERLNFILKRIFDLLSSSSTGSTDFSAQLADLQKQINALAKKIASTPPSSGGGVTLPINESDVTNLVTDLASKTPTSRLINTTTPLTGGGDLSADRTLGITQATAGTAGFLTAADWNTFSGKMSNPMNALGDIIYGGAAGTPTKLAAGSSGTVLHGGPTPSWSAVVETDFAFTNIGTANASATKHGLLPILSNNPTQFLDGQGNWATPAGQANGYTTQAFVSQTTVTVTHNFGSYPAVQVLDGSGNILEAKTVQHTSVNSFTVTFVISTTGTIIATIGSPQAQSVKVVTNDYAILLTDRIIECSVSGKTITLPTAVGNIGFEFAIDNSSNGDITLASSGGTIEDEISQTIPSESAIHCYSDGVNWRIW